MAEGSTKNNMWAWIFGSAALLFLATAVVLFFAWRKEKAKNPAAKPGTTPPKNPATSGPNFSANVTVTDGANPANANVVANNTPSASVV